jgi:ketosteroid isomerase-like protein
MSQERVELVQRGLVTLAKGEMLWDTLDEDVEIRDHDILDQQGYNGHAGFAQWLEDWGLAWSEYTFEPEDFIDGGDVVVAVIHLTAKGRSSGIEIDRRDAIVYAFRDGKIATIDYYNDKAQALQAAGLADQRE